jgi:uncharacterized protein YdeI (YjbR/CyaY-like superfamily)
MSVLDDAERLDFTTAAAWQSWLAEHYTRKQGVWLVQYKSRTGKPAIPYEDAIRVALCFGWIDSTYRSVDEERGMLWWSPRRKGSVWARSNKERVEQLEAEGRMTDAGRAVIAAAKADGSWSILESVEALSVPADLAASLAARPGADESWEAMVASARRPYLLWIATAKRPETRARRVLETADRVALGLRFEDR